MDSDEELFRRVMADLDVRPQKEGRTGRSSRDGESMSMAEAIGEMDDKVRDQADRDLFLNHLNQLGAVPDKEASAIRLTEHGLRKRKLRKKENISTDDRIDLHGLTRDEAIPRLASFVARSFANNLRSVMVITGKGKHSPGQIGVLRIAVEDWVRHQGGRFIHSYAEAPRAFGGSGAFILYIRRT